MGGEELDAVHEVFEHGGVIVRFGDGGRRGGTYPVEEFERAFARRMGARRSLAVTSDTAALGVGNGDEVPGSTQ